jgi:hypothetical protein
LLKRASAVVVCVALAQLVPVVTAQPGEPQRASGLSLSPAVVMLEGKPGQGHRETLRLTNNTASPMSFELVAQDVLAAGDERVFLPAGDRQDSIAATAVFSPATVMILPGETGTVEMTLTVPDVTAVRAVAAIFRGLSRVREDAHVTMTASLGTLVTFTLSTDLRLEAAEPVIVPQSESASLRIEEQVSNSGTEPVIAGGAVAVLDAHGRLIGRLPIDPHRLLPNERVTVLAEYPGWIDVGDYQAIVSLAFGQQVINRSVNFRVDPAATHSAPGRRAAGDQ